MPRPDPRAPGDGQEQLFEAVAVQPPGKITRGRHSTAVDKAITAAKADQALTDADEAALSLVRAGAWALDTFEAKNMPYGPAKLINPVLDALVQLRMTPETRAVAQDDELERLLRDLGTASNPAAPVRDGA